MRLLRSLLLILSISISACQSLPPAPSGNLCIVDLASHGDDCAPISNVVDASIDAGTAVIPVQAMLKTASDIFVPYEQTDNYVCFSPDTWSGVQVYINELQDRAQNSCQ